MNTPITATADDYQIRAVAQKLELDRAALMKALKAVLKYSTPTASARIDATRILAAARANFPES